MFTRPHSLLSTATPTIYASQLTALHISTTSCHTTRDQWPRQRICTHTRHYASVADDSKPRETNSEGHGQHVWPEAPEGHSCPTPYQIFAMTRNQTYSKAQFHSLVKLYHPDRGELNAQHLSLPLHVRLERYRLIVSAHNILSDPLKRSAYDRMGVGWQSKLGSVEPGSRDNPTGPFNYNWQGNSDPIWSNATWEDWERFHAHREAQENGEAEPQRPLMMSNATFILLVFTIIFAGSAANVTRAKDNGQYFVEQRDIVHDRAAKDLRRVRVEKQTMGDRNDRVEWFMRQREATLGTSSSDIGLMREEMAERILPNKDICRSEEVAQQARVVDD